MRGETGRVRVEILLSPELPPRVQTFALTSVPEPPAALAAAAAAIVHAMQPTADAQPVAIDWPASLSVGAAVDVGAVVRAMRAAEARFAPLTLGLVIDGDGERKATFRVAGARGNLDLALTMDPERVCLDSVSLIPTKLVPPDFL